jgi:hypothetical protein
MNLAVLFENANLMAVLFENANVMYSSWPVSAVSLNTFYYLTLSLENGSLLLSRSRADNG